MPQAVQEGFVRVPGGQIWYRVLGNGPAAPLLTLHGGPGSGHDYLDTLQALAEERPVIFFDQLGCGKSDHPDDDSLWHIDRFVDEIEALAEALGLRRVHLLGHSWGGWLALEYMLRQPGHVASLTLYSTSASLPEYVREANRLKRALPHNVRATLDRLEAKGELDSNEYQDKIKEFYRRFVCGLDPWPESLSRSMQNLVSSPDAYITMLGLSEFFVSGNLSDWNRISNLDEITVPTLIACGRHEAAGPRCAETLLRGIRASRLHIFEQSRHVAHLEQTEEFLQVVNSFLNLAEFGSLG